MISFPPAKINVGLSIQSKRPDGYHEIATIMTQIPLFDILEVQKSDRFSFMQSGLLLPADGNLNLCERAFALMNERYDISPVNIHLRKQIPIGAGLGGGSSDAAHVLKALNELFSLYLANTELENLAAELGSDCPFFIEETPKLATGRGEKLSSVPDRLKGNRLVLLNPKIHVSTAFAYGQVTPKENELNWKNAWDSPVSQWQKTLVNDFEKPIGEHFPRIAEIIRELKNQGALYAAMSGSGSSVFGIFDKEATLDLRKYQEFVLLDKEIL